MGMLDDEEKKNADEAAAAVRAELNQVACNVSQDLMSYIGMNPRLQGPNIETAVDENRVTMRKKWTSHIVEIVCIGRGSFELTVDGASHGTTNQNAMARSVLEWLER
jgi:hypothetical protein